MRIMVVARRLRQRWRMLFFVIVGLLGLSLYFFGIQRNLYQKDLLVVSTNQGKYVGQDLQNEYVQNNVMSNPHGSYKQSDEATNITMDKEIIRDFFSTSRLVKKANCELIFSNDDSEINRVKKLTKQSTQKSFYKYFTKNCTRFIKKRRYVISSVTEEEMEFPLAFSILAYKDVEMVEQLLRAIYRPQNYYCIHLDSKASETDRKAIEAIASCFQNVLLSSTSVSVTWGEFTVLLPELICMKDLWRYKKWKYFINLTGQEFPLKTNQELVKILKAMKGANLVDGTRFRVLTERFEQQKDPVPHNITISKGSVHIAVNRDFVDFCLHDNRSFDFLDWLRSTWVSDETFFSSLNHNPHLGIPGTFLGDVEEYPKKPSFTRYKNWMTGHGAWARPCSGKYVRYTCVLGVGDLHRLKNDIGLFANKFNAGFEPLALDCLEELIHNRTRDQYLHGAPIDVSFYRDLDQVRLQVKPKNDSE